MIVQHDEYGTIPQAVRDVVANKIALLDLYLLCQTGENEYTALIYNPNTKECREIIVTRGDSYGQYSLLERSGEWAYTINNECYVYSNVGQGAALDLPVVAGVTAHASMILCCALMFAIVFKGVLFPCLKRKRKGF